MATDTKIRKRSDPNALTQSEVDKKFDELTANLDPEKKEQQEHDREYVTHKLAEKAGERIRKLSLNIKASPELRKEIEELAHDIEGSVPRLAAKARTDDALITQIEAAVDKAEKYIISAAKEEEKRGKKEEEKRKEKDHKVHPHEPEKPESADKTTEEKTKADIEALKKELQGDNTQKQESEVVTTAAIGVTAGMATTAIQQEPHADKQENQDTPPSEQSSKDRNLTLEQRTTLRQKELRQEVSREPEEQAKNTNLNDEAQQPRRRMSPDTAMKRPFAKGGPDQKKIPGSSQNAVTPKYTPPKGQYKIPALDISSNPLAGKIKMGSMRRIGIIPGITETTHTVNITESGDIIEEYDEYGLNPEQNDRGKNISGNFRDSDSYGTPQTQAGGGGSNEEGNDSGGGNNNIKRGGLGVPGPHIPNPITRGGLGVPQVSKLTQGGAGGLAKGGAKALLSIPQVRLALIIGIAVLIVLLLIVVLIVAIAGGGSGQGNGTCQAAAAPAPETLTPQVIGPTTATEGEIVPYQITLADTQPSQEITVVATIPQGMSINQTDITSSWTRFTVIGNTLTWKATENLPPNSLNPANFNFTVSLKATAQVPDAKLNVNATPTRAAAPAAPNPGTSGGAVPIAKEKSTEELKSIYGATQQEVEAQLVTIDFQGKQVKVHKKVQGVFEKVNREITAANTGYNFRLIGTFSWRQKNCPSGCSGLSTHSFGTTIDINWDTNPYTTANTHDIPPAVVEIFKNNGFEWGGDWGANGGSKDWMHFQYNGEPGAVVGGNCAPGGSVSADYVPPSDNTCEGKYTANMSKNPTKKNFGDPTCNFTKDALHNLLRTEDPQDADFWFNEVVRCESAYNPNAWASPSTGTPDPGGAWGLYQMGSSTPPGQAPPAEGRGGPTDRGDVPWVLQTKNAVAKSNQLGGDQAGMRRYWACAR